MLPTIALEPKENYKNNFSRNYFVLLRNENSEYSANVSSVSVNLFDKESFITPNRDYSNQGFLVDINGKTWKVLDSIGFSLRDEKLKEVPLNPSEVFYNLISATYTYKTIENGKLYIEFSLCSSLRKNTSSLRIRIYNENIPSYFKLLLYFLVKLKPIKGEQIPFNVFSKIPNKVLCSNGKIKVTVETQEVINLELSKVRSLVWSYKQGHGSRSHSNVFAEEKEEIYVVGPFLLDLRNNPIEVNILTREEADQKNEILKEISCIDAVAISRIDSLISLLPFSSIEDQNIRNVLSGRLLALLSFGKRLYINSNTFIVPTSGAFWLREINFKDIYECLYWNLNTYLLLGLQNFLLDQARLGFFVMDDSGKIPDFLIFEESGVRAYFNSILPTLLFHRFVQRLSVLMNNKELFTKSYGYFKKFVHEVLDGNGKVKIENGIIFTPPNFGWISDSYELNINSKIIHNFPERLSVDFARVILDKYNEKEFYEKLNSSSYILPEVQSLFTLILNKYLQLEKFFNVEDNSLSKISEEFLERTIEMTEKSNGNLLPNFIYKDDREFFEDSKPSSLSLSSVSILCEYLNHNILNRALETCRKELLVYRKLMKLGSETFPFGLIVKKT